MRGGLEMHTWAGRCISVTCFEKKAAAMPFSPMQPTGRERGTSDNGPLSLALLYNLP